MSDNFSTKTIISFTNIIIDMEKFFNYIPIRDIAIERKNNRKKKIENVFNIEDRKENIPSGSILCVKWRNQERGTIIKTASIVRNSNKNKKKRDKYFLNSITTIMYFNNDKYKDKLINLKITNTGRIQMTGCKDDELTISCIHTLINIMDDVKEWLGVDLYTMNNTLCSQITNKPGVHIILYTVMKNKNINIGFKINREKLDSLINKNYNDYISIFDGTTSGAGVNIKTKVKNWEKSLPIYTFYNKQISKDEVNMEKVIKLFTKSTKHNENKYHTFLCFKSGSCIHSGRGEHMEIALEEFITILHKNRDEIEDK
jgi:hypothetical protein